MPNSECIFAGCNRALKIFAYNNFTSKVAYASHNSIQITAPLVVQNSQLNPVFKPIITLSGPKTPVTCLKWLPQLNRLVVGSQSGDVFVWVYCGDDFKLDQVFQACSHSITCLESCNDTITLGDSDGGLFFYVFTNGEFQLNYNYKFPYGFFPMCISLQPIPNSDEMIAFIGGSKPTVHVLLMTAQSCEIVNSLPGHEDWVKSISIKQLSTTEYLIATGCLDRVIRLWKLVLESNETPEVIETNKLKLLTSKEYKFHSSKYRGKVFIDSVLMGHDDWIGDLIWKDGDDLILMSSSADSSIMIWKPDSESGVWYPDIRLGGVSIKGASTATGASGGFFTCAWVVQNGIEVVLTNGKTGSFRCWVRKDGDEEYEQVYSITGSSLGITDLSWDPKGSYLLSTSLDQTTRLYSKDKSNGEWFEFGRPQIHGFDMISIAALNGTKFISAGDEKVIRVFEMPNPISNMLTKLTSFQKDEDVSLPETATLPVLGLSNKANFDNTTTIEEEEGNEEGQTFATSLINDMDKPPMEDVLQRYTLWPEIEKLYGHGFEITTLDISPDSQVLVSASRSNVFNHAGLRVFDINTWLEVDQGTKGGLLGHDLTVTRLRFNGKTSGTINNKVNDIYLLAVSRDRKLSLWKKSGTKFELVEIVEKAHSRIIWDCAWVETEGQVSFVTVSRDKEIKLWVLNMGTGKLENKSQYKFDIPITSVDSFSLGEGKFKLGVGLDKGQVMTLDLDVNAFEFSNLQLIGTAGGSITRIKFSPFEPIMACGSTDSSLRLFKLDI